jgi:hypothetical protein
VLSVCILLLSRRPIGQGSVQLASQTVHFQGSFQQLSRVRLIESSRFMERAMGIELISQFLSPSETRRYHRSKSQLVPFGAKSSSKNSAPMTVHGSVDATRCAVYSGCECC